ncbi:MAG: hypothetical protein M3Q03_01370 [Chloroflexota bacterium]|nr:hypothetical protein [Chloroflexota bacterium]
MFNPQEHLIDIKGKKYLPVASRIQWFRDQHPQGVIGTELVERGQGYAVFQAKIVVIDDKNFERTLSTGYGSETKDDWKDYLEKAETKAIGRALAAAGFGTQFTDDFDMDADGTKVVDAPQPVQRTTNVETGEVTEVEPVLGPDEYWNDVEKKIYKPGVCDICSKKVPAKSVSFSQYKFQRTLCWDHQKTMEAVA